MTSTGSRALEPERFAFLAMFLARTHRMLYRAQNVVELGEELGFSTTQARACAIALQRRGLLRSLSAMSPEGPLMEITPEGISMVRASVAANARAGGEPA